MTSRGHVARLALLAVLLAGCGGKPAMPPASEAQLPAELRTGDVLVRATTLPSMRLSEAMAQRYGVDRDPGQVLLVIGLRRGSPANESSLRGRVTARASDLLGNRQQIALREVRDGEPGSTPEAGFTDYAGSVRVSMPDTLRFEIEAAPEGAPAATLRFHRDFFPVE